MTLVGIHRSVGTVPFGTTPLDLSVGQSVDVTALSGLPGYLQAIGSFLLVVLFGAASWKAMEGEVLSVWRNIIALGVIFTGLGTLGFYTDSGQSLLFGSSLLYWFLAPGAGFKITSELIDEKQEVYRDLAIRTLPTTGLFLLGYVSGNSLILGTALMFIAVIQTWSIVIASRMDNDW